MPVTQLLIAANVLVFLAQAAAADSLLGTFALWPLGRYLVPGVGVVGFHAWQIVTSAFLHGGAAHLGLNMLALHMFGRDVERLLGSARTLALYAAAIVTAGLAQVLVVSAAGSVTPTVGASGGVFGILLAFAVLFPERSVMLLFPPIPLPARTFVLLFGLLELAHGVLGTRSGVAHFAHLGGMLGAGLVLWRWRVRRRPRWEP